MNVDVQCQGPKHEGVVGKSMSEHEHAEHAEMNLNTWEKDRSETGVQENWKVNGSSQGCRKRYGC